MFYSKLEKGRGGWRLRISSLGKGDLKSLEPAWKQNDRSKREMAQDFMISRVNG